jgi:hypothetical protein
MGGVERYSLITWETRYSYVMTVFLDQIYGQDPPVKMHNGFPNGSNLWPRKQCK